MAFSIQPGCTGCGDCLPACPNGAIVAVAPVYRIVAALCTECVGYADTAVCASLCPEQAIVFSPDAQNLVLR